jgi:hypothetical protein
MHESADVLIGQGLRGIHQRQCTQECSHTPACQGPLRLERKFMAHQRHNGAAILRDSHRFTLGKVQNGSKVVLHFSGGNGLLSHYEFSLAMMMSILATNQLSHHGARSTEQQPDVRTSSCHRQTDLGASEASEFNHCTEPAPAQRPVAKQAVSR